MIMPSQNHHPWRSVTAANKWAQSPGKSVQCSSREIKSKLRKRAREVVSIPTLYNDTLIELSTQPDCSVVAPSLPTLTELLCTAHCICLLHVFVGENC